MKRFYNQKGFSLVECMVSVTILTIIMGAVLGYLFMTLNTYKQESEKTNVNLDGRTILAMMTNELRTAYNISYTDSQGNKKHGKIIYYKSIDENGRFIDESRKEISASQLPWQGGNYKKINLSFIQTDKPELIEIELTLDNSKFTTSVFLSNKNIQGTEESEDSNE